MVGSSQAKDLRGLSRCLLLQQPYLQCIAKLCRVPSSCPVPSSCKRLIGSITSAWKDLLRMRRYTASTGWSPCRGMPSVTAALA